MKNTLALVLPGLLMLSACGNGTGSTSSPPQRINENASVTGTTSDRPAGRADTEDPETGTAFGRPDSPRDLEPGTDGNTNLPAP